MKNTIVDLNFKSPEAEQTIANEIAQSLSTSGFFYIKDSPRPSLVPQAQDMFDNGSLKRAAQSPNTLNRGYLANGLESGSSSLEIKESFAFGKEPETLSNSLSALNNWPSDQSSFRSSMLSFFNDMIEKSRALCRVLSLAMGQPRDYLDGMTSKGAEISLMRVFNYHVGDDGIGSSPHTDWGLCSPTKFRIADADSPTRRWSSSAAR